MAAGNSQNPHYSGYSAQTFDLGFLLFQYSLLASYSKTVYEYKSAKLEARFLFKWDTAIITNYDWSMA
jgi:hypothetical protein